MKTKHQHPNQKTPMKCCPASHLIWLGMLFGIASAFGAETIVWQDKFDDAFPDDRWSAENGVWQIGSPTNGPATNALGCRTYSGCKTATTGLSGDYPPFADTRFIRITPFVVPPATNYPRLRFWQWYSFAGGCSCGYNCTDEGSYGYVEIKPSGGDWQAVSPHYTGSTVCWGDWWRPSIDLSPYADQTVQLAFHFHSAACTNVGWYVDDVALVTNDPPVFNNPEGFEVGMGDWTIDSSGGIPTWQVGVPVSPYAAHSGTNCAATMLTGNYCSYSDSRFISPPMSVPASNSYPRLRFWHWYSFAAGCSCGYNCTDEGSFGYVEIRTTNGWQTVSPTYRGTSCEGWWRPSLDLQAYAGQVVQVAFHFHSASCTGPGWYLDDVAIETGPPSLYNPEGFEAGVGDWTTDFGTWQIGTPTSGPGGAHAGTNCAATILAGNYCAFADSRLISPVFVVPPCDTNPLLRFWHWYSFAGGCSCGYNCTDEGSFGYVEIKSGANNWQIVSPTYSGNSGNWSQPFVDLKPFCGQTVQVAFHFHSASCIGPGWYVDDVRLVRDFALVLLGSPTVRTQTTACIPLGFAQTFPAATVDFTLHTPGDYLNNVSFNGNGCWSGTVTPQSGSQWSVNLQNNLQNNCTNTPMGLKSAGSLCFTAANLQSAFVPITLTGLLVMNPDATSPVAEAFGTRTVIIANEPLLEAWLGSTGQRMLTTYGKANTQYEIRQATNLAQPWPWPLAWSNTVPSTMSISEPVQGDAANSPRLWLRANAN